MDNMDDTELDKCFLTVYYARPKCIEGGEQGKAPNPRA
ncbi:hypothetical protein CASFOL_042290 [Castilleja foliolosa]|uniref:Uncharacterized protein n=1 Tax=Castilleja foliolosa TaxID=1961234 RepID=A0ABD3BAU2_9LAMI